jgi:2-desacetyl-2-hydroxyethyl bacteriochlorophyllide A dehydrogenase
MKAAVYHGSGEIRVEDVVKPNITEDEILVKVKACGICGSDLHAYRLPQLGFFEALARPVENGHIMGHELSGEVVEVGRKVCGFRVGDRITGAAVGGFAEYVPILVSERSPFLLPDKIPFEEGAMVEPLATSLHGAELARPALGETVVILGAGIIGLGCLQVLRLLVPCRVIVVDTSAKRLDMARRLGAEDTVNLTEVDPVETVIGLTGGARPLQRYGTRGGNADAVIDCAGARLAPNQGLAMLKQENGRLVLVATYEQQPELDFNQVVRKNVSVLGSWAWTPDEYRKSIALIQSGRIERKPLLSHEFPLSKAPEAFATQSRPDAAIKVIIKP